MQFLYVGRAWPNEEVITCWERYGSYSGLKILNFQKHALVEICTL